MLIINLFVLALHRILQGVVIFDAMGQCFVNHKSTNIRK
jgi:hypothetical protein